MKFTAVWRQLSIGALCFAAFTSQAEEIRPEFSAEMLNGILVQPTAIDTAKRQAAKQISRMLADPLFAASLSKQLNTSPKVGREQAAKLSSVLDDFQQSQLATGMVKGKSTDAGLRQLEKSVLQSKGLSGLSNGLLQVRLYQPANQKTTVPVDLSQTLVAFEPAGNEKQWRVVEAYDCNGKVHTFDARVAPQVPVLVADIDSREDLRAGLQLANRTLVERGMQSKQVANSALTEPGVSDLPGVSNTRSGVNAAASNRNSHNYIETAKLDRIQLKDDMEPWISGAAEIYAMVSGVQPDQSKAQIELIEMPYLDYSGQTYTPNQILFFWSNYRFAAANIQFFEHDDNTNYKDLVVAVTSGVEKILGVFKPEYAVIATVASAIIQAMPSKWFENSDDYVDSFYTLEKNRTYTDWAGAGSNVTMTLTPYRLQKQ